MLELELALKPFVERRLSVLNVGDLCRFADLLEHDDWDIFDWVQGRSEPDDAGLAALIAAIRAANTP
jgi:antitoxin CptB